MNKPYDLPTWKLSEPQEALLQDALYWFEILDECLQRCGIDVDEDDRAEINQAMSAGINTLSLVVNANVRQVEPLDAHRKRAINAAREQYLWLCEQQKEEVTS